VGCLLAACELFAGGSWCRSGENVLQEGKNEIEKQENEESGYRERKKVAYKR
jgi:hypothetical protein